MNKGTDKEFTSKSKQFRIPQAWKLPNIRVFGVFNLSGDVTIVIVVSRQDIPRDLERRLFKHFCIGFIESRVVLVVNAREVEIVTWFVRKLIKKYLKT